MRLFVAVDPPPEVVELLRALGRPPFRDVRWTAEPQWHVTLRFLGEVDEADVASLAGALDTVPGTLSAGATPAEATLGPAVAWFPGRRVLQVPVAGLEALAAATGEATAPWGVPPEHRFRGHLTLARVRGRRPGPAVLAGMPLSAAWPVGELVLYCSTRGPAGSEYEALHRTALPA